MDNTLRNTAYSIGVSHTNMMRLYDLSIPAPDQTVISYSRYYVRLDGTKVADGYMRCVWMWDVLSRASLSILMNAIGATESDTYKMCYIGTDVRNSVINIPYFRIYQATLHIPILDGNDGVMIAKSALGYQSIKLLFNRLGAV